MASTDNLASLLCKKKIDKVILFFCFIFCVQGTPHPPLQSQVLLYYIDKMARNFMFHVTLFSHQRLTGLALYCQYTAFSETLF